MCAKLCPKRFHQYGRITAMHVCNVVGDTFFWPWSVLFHLALKLLLPKAKRLSVSSSFSSFWAQIWSARTQFSSSFYASRSQVPFSQCLDIFWTRTAQVQHLKGSVISPMKKQTVVWLSVWINWRLVVSLSVLKGKRPCSILKSIDGLRGGGQRHLKKRCCTLPHHVPTNGDQLFWVSQWNSKAIHRVCYLPERNPTPPIQTTITTTASRSLTLNAWGGGGGQNCCF